MTTLYDPSVLYDRRTMPLVRYNNCDFVRFFWVCTERQQRQVDAQNWAGALASLADTYMANAAANGSGVPGWDPFFGLNEETLFDAEYRRLAANDFTHQVAHGTVRPTGLEEDPRVWRPATGDPPTKDIRTLLHDAAARYEAAIAAEHQRLLQEHAAQRNGSWAARARAGPVPTLEDARKSYTARHAAPTAYGYVHEGTWHEWEVVEVNREQTRQDGIEAAWARADANAKAVIGPTWGGGT